MIVASVLALSALMCDDCFDEDDFWLKHFIYGSRWFKLHDGRLFVLHAKDDRKQLLRQDNALSMLGVATFNGSRPHQSMTAHTGLRRVIVDILWIEVVDPQCHMLKIM